ncbi:Lipooligosaccharide biosynthesis protein lex-1, partial [Haemophilus influenzae]
MNGTI